MGNCFPAGIDIGSTTVKLVILDTNGQILFGQYRRHRAHTQETLAQLLREARQQLGPCSLRVGITGSGSMNLGKAMDIGFVQEVVAVASSLERVAPQTDVAIELAAAKRRMSAVLLCRARRGRPAGGAYHPCGGPHRLRCGDKG